MSGLLLGIVLSVRNCWFLNMVNLTSWLVSTDFVTRSYQCLYINYQLLCTDCYLFIKYQSPLHASSLKCSSSGRYSCTHAAYGTVTLYESSWWLVGTQLEWELTVRGERLLVGVLRHPPTTFPLVQSVLTQTVYLQATRTSHREWQYHMLHVYNCILLKMSTWGSKHVEEINILWINNNQCTKVGN